MLSMLLNIIGSLPAGKSCAAGGGCGEQPGNQECILTVLFGLPVSPVVMIPILLRPLQPGEILVTSTVLSVILSLHGPGLGARFEAGEFRGKRRLTIYVVW